MVSQATINNKDIWNTWKARFQRGTISALLTPPSMKDYVINESRSLDGIIIDVVNPRVKAREVELHVVIRGSSRTEFLANKNSFENELKSGVLTLKYNAIPNTTFTLIYQSSGGQFGRYGTKAGKFVYRFLEPNPANR